MDLRDYVRVLGKHWFGMLLIFVLCTAAAFGYTYLQPRVYTASAQMFVSISTKVTTGANGQTSVSSSTPYVLQRLTSYVQVVDSPRVLQPVIDGLGLDISVAGLAPSVSATNPTGTVILDISVTNLDPVRAADIANAVAQQLSTVIQDLEAQTLGSSVLVKATLTKPAEPPSAPSSPRTRVNILLGMVIGLMLGLGYAFLRDHLDNTVKTHQDLADLTGASSLGMIMYDPAAKNVPLVALDQRAVRSESFRSIRTNLRYISVDEPPKVITITSAVPNEGKSTTAINLAITLAQAGWRVCLVEADLRRPKLGAYLGIEMGVGLTSVLSGQHTLDDALLSWNRGAFTVLPSGNTPPNPSEMLGSRQMREVLSTLRSRFDVVLIDAPPLLPVTDGAIVTTVSDGAILIVRWGKTTREQLIAATNAIEQVDGRILGTVMNFVPSTRRRYSYKYNYGYGYGYGHGYGASGDKAPAEV